jgi:hypothetical protein
MSRPLPGWNFKMTQLRIKAGRRIYEMIKDGGFNFDSVTAYFGPAAGPRWLIASGFDLTLLTCGLLGRRRTPVHLIGSSAGAWRFATWLQPEAAARYQQLMDAYIDIRYTKADTPATILEKFKDLVNLYLEDDALSFALANKKYRLAVITARARNLVASEKIWIQKTGLIACYLLNFLSRNNIYFFADRVVFYSGSKPPGFCLQPHFRGSFVRLNETNFKYALMASGAIPLAVRGIHDIYGAPRGVYRDGGLIDYHLTHQYASGKNDIVLFFHHQERIIPGWLDKENSRRIPDEEALSNVLMVFPSQNFIEKLPGGKVPDRTDFITYIDDHKTRTENWRKAVALAATLGEEFLELVESRQLNDVVERL